MAYGVRIEKRKKIALGAAVLLGPGALLVTILFFFAPKAPYVSISTSEEFRGATVQIETRGSKAFALDRAPKTGGHIFQKPEGITGNYILSAAIGDGDGYRDISFRVDEAEKSVSVVASGFAPGEALSVRSGVRTVETGLHFDWAGRIEITHDFAKDKSGPLCLETSSGFSFCHILPAGGNA